MVNWDKAKSRAPLVGSGVSQASPAGAQGQWLFGENPENQAPTASNYRSKKQKSKAQLSDEPGAIASRNMLWTEGCLS